MQTRAQLIDAYRATSYDVRSPNGARATLRIGKLVPEVLCSWARRDWPLFFISASNPGSNWQPSTENRKRTRALLAKLDHEGVRKLIGVGRPSLHVWRETSFLTAGLSPNAADNLAIEFGQNAIVVASDPNSTQLRLYRNEWRTHIAHDAYIERPGP